MARALPLSGLLALLLLVQPLAPRLVDSPWTLHALAVAGLLLAAAPGLWRARRVRAGVPALAVLAALASLGLALARLPAEAPAAEVRWAAFTGLMHALTFLVALHLLPGPEADDDTARRVALGLALLLSAAAVLQLGLALSRAPDAGATRLSGTLGNPNVFGSLQSAALLAVLGAGWALSERARAAGRTGLDAARPLLLAAPAAAPLAWALLASRSRGVVAASFGVLLLLALRWRRWRLLAAAGVALVALLAVPNPLRERLLHLQPEHVFGRGFLWGVALDVAAQHPTGIGPALFKHEFPRHALDPERPWLLHQRHEVGLAHNVFLTLAVEWGWLAAGALLALAAWAAWRSLAARGGRRDPLRLAATAAGAALLFELQVDALEQNPAVFTVFVVLAAAVVARLPRGRGPALPGPLLAAGAVLLALAAGGLAAWRGAGQAQLRAAESLAAACPPGAEVDPVEAAFAAAARALPGELAPHREWLEFAVARLRECPPANGLDEVARAAALRAERAADAALAVNGLDEQVRWLAAEAALLSWRRGRRPEDLARWLAHARAALELDPLDVEGHFELAQEALRAGLHDDCLRQLERVFALEPDHAFGWLVRARLAEADGDAEAALHAWVRADEAILNARRKAAVDSPRSREFYVRMLERTDRAVVRARLGALRRELYF